MSTSTTQAIERLIVRPLGERERELGAKETFERVTFLRVEHIDTGSGQSVDVQSNENRTSQRVGADRLRKSESVAGHGEKVQQGTRVSRKALHLDEASRGA